MAATFDSDGFPNNFDEEFESLFDSPEDLSAAASSVGHSAAFLRDFQDDLDFGLEFDFSGSMDVSEPGTVTDTASSAAQFNQQPVQLQAQTAIGISQQPVQLQTQNAIGTNQQPIQFQAQAAIGTNQQSVHTQNAIGINQKPVQVQTQTGIEFNQQPVHFQTQAAIGTNQQPVQLQTQNAIGINQKPVQVQTQTGIEFIQQPVHFQTQDGMQLDQQFVTQLPIPQFPANAQFQQALVQSPAIDSAQFKKPLVSQLSTTQSPTQKGVSTSFLMTPPVSGRKKAVKKSAPSPKIISAEDYGLANHRVLHCIDYPQALVPLEEYRRYGAAAPIKPTKVKKVQQVSPEVKQARARNDALTRERNKYQQMVRELTDIDPETGKTTFEKIKLENERLRRANTELADAHKKLKEQCAADLTKYTKINDEHNGLLRNLFKAHTENAEMRTRLGVSPSWEAGF